MQNSKFPSFILWCYIIMTLTLVVVFPTESPYFDIISFGFLCIVTILTSVVIIKNKAKGLPIIVVNILTFLICLLFFLYLDQTEYQNMIGLLSLLNGIINIFISLCYYIKSKQIEQTNIKSTNYSLPVLDNRNLEISRSQPTSKKTYPIGVIDAKSNTILSIFLASLLIMVLVFIYAYVLTASSVFIICIFLYFFVSTLIYIILFSKHVNKAINNYSQDLNYEILENSILEIYNNPKVHPETKNYYLIILAAHAFSVDQEKYKLYRSVIFCPKHKQYLLTYQTSFLHHLLPPDEFVKTYNELRFIYKQNKHVLRSLTDYYNRWKTIVLNEPCDNIELICPLNHKVKLVSAANTYIQFIYYFNQGNYQKASELACLFFEMYSPLKEQVKSINEKLELIKSKK